MPVLKFKTTEYSLDKNQVILIPSGEYSSVVQVGIDRITKRNSSRDDGDVAPLEVSIEWHVKKMSFDQLKLFWALLEVGASLQVDAEIPSPGEIKRLANSLYEDYLLNQGPRAEAIINEEAEDQFREKFHRVLRRTVLDDGRVYILALIGASQWTTKQAGIAIDYWFNELAQIGVNVADEAGLAHYWREWRVHLASEGIDIIDPDAEMTADQYRKATPISECCGIWLGTEGEIAHIKAKGIGGNPEEEKDKPGNWLHLCTEHHRFVQHQKGWAKLLKIAPWLRNKVEKALRRKV